jgi:hypothetical protein
MTVSVDSLPLDPGIREAVELLQEAGVETFESCQGGEGHAFPEPTIRFHGNNVQGFRAYAAAMEYGLPVLALKRSWSVIDGELSGPWWEMVFHQGVKRR